jgi:EAL domain-containing protein (putative c-di-GMP-specific phosphodiesterase class I)
VMETIAHLGHRLNLSIVVEGVETEDEFEIVKALGCQTIQGYLFGRPGTLPRNEEAASLASVA